MEIKKLIEDVLMDLADNKTLTDVSSKIQIIVRLLGDEKLKTWYTCEFVTGYKNQELPNYRISRAADVKANYLVPQGYGVLQLSGQSIPVGNLDSVEYEEIMTIRFNDTIASIIEYSKHPKDIAMSLSSYEKVLVQKVLGEVHIQNVYKVLSPSTLQTIIDSVKGRIIDMFMDLNEKVFDGGLDLKSKSAKEEIHQVITNNITAGIVHTGDGTINASNVTNVIGDNNTVSTASIGELKEILRKIESLIETQNPECREICDELKEELSNPTPAKRILKRGFQALKGLALSVSTEVLTGKLTPLLEQALSLL